METAKAPEWTQSEQTIEVAKSYLRDSNSVDFFEMITRKILQSQPTDLARFCYSIIENMVNSEEIATETSCAPALRTNDSYLHRENLSAFIDEWVLALLHERPASDTDRLMFHKKYLSAKMTSS